MSFKLTSAAVAWFRLLTTTKITQIVEYLHIKAIVEDDTEGMDALGIAYLSAKVKEGEPSKEQSHIVSYEGYIDQLSPNMITLLGVRDDQATFLTKAPGGFISVADMNDRGKTFKEIAAYMRTDLANVFLTPDQITKALEESTTDQKKKKDGKRKSATKTKTTEKKEPADKAAKEKKPADKVPKAKAAKKKEPAKKEPAKKEPAKKEPAEKKAPADKKPVNKAAKEKAKAKVAEKKAPAKKEPAKKEPANEKPKGKVRIRNKAKPQAGKAEDKNPTDKAEDKPQADKAPPKGKVRIRNKAKTTKGKDPTDKAEKDPTDKAEGKDPTDKAEGKDPTDKAETGPSTSELVAEAKQGVDDSTRRKVKGKLPADLGDFT